VAALHYQPNIMRNIVFSNRCDKAAAGDPTDRQYMHNKPVRSCPQLVYTWTFAYLYSTSSLIKNTGE
jgi:hypothetical protein